MTARASSTRSAADVRTTEVWTVEAVRALGATTDVETAGSILGVGRTTAYMLAKSGRFPVRVLRVGHRYVVPVRGVLDALGVK